MLSSMTLLQRLSSAAGVAALETSCALMLIRPNLQDPAVLEKVQALAKNETFQAKVHALAADASISSAASAYADYMNDELINEHHAGSEGAEDGLGLSHPTGEGDGEEDADEEDEDEDEDEDEEDEEEDRS